MLVVTILADHELGTPDIRDIERSTGSGARAIGKSVAVSEVLGAALGSRGDPCSSRETFIDASGMRPVVHITKNQMG